MVEPPAHSAAQVTHTPTLRAAWTATCLATLLLTTGLGLGLPQRSGFDVQRLFLIFMMGGFATIGQLIALSPFRPAWDRIRDVVDRRFYRTRYDATRTLAQFTAHLRNQLDADALIDNICRVVDETVLPEHVALWTRPVRGAER